MIKNDICQELPFSTTRQSSCLLSSSERRLHIMYRHADCLIGKLYLNSYRLTLGSQLQTVQDAAWQKLDPFCCNSTTFDQEIKHTRSAVIYKIGFAMQQSLTVHSFKLYAALGDYYLPLAYRVWPCVGVWTAPLNHSWLDFWLWQLIKVLSQHRAEYNGPEGILCHQHLWVWMLPVSFTTWIVILFRH